ncbi:MAG: hypothetical protein RCG15_04330 [Candidatus Rickettsia vulgarisii]
MKSLLMTSSIATAVINVNNAYGADLPPPPPINELNTATSSTSNVVTNNTSGKEDLLNAIKKGKVLRKVDTSNAATNSSSASKSMLNVLSLR